MAADNVALMKLLGAKASPQTIEHNVTTKEAALKALADSYDYGVTVLGEQTDASIADAIKLPNFNGTRARPVWSAIGHAWDEYGVMTVYLRLNAIVPPASRGR